MLSPKDMRSGAYEILIAKMRSRFQTACDIPLPRDLKNIIFEYYKPTEVEHFECVLQTGFVKARVESGHDGIVFKGRSGAVFYGSHRMKWIMSEFDSMRFAKIAEFHFAIIFDSESYNSGNPYMSMTPIWLCIEKQIYSSFKRAAAKYMYRILRSKK